MPGYLRLFATAKAETGKAEPDACFSVGLLSICDALAGRSMAEVLDELPLDRSVTDALLDRTGPMGAALTAAIACERGELPEHDADLTLACYSDAVAWTEAQGLF